MEFHLEHPLACFEETIDHNNSNINSDEALSLFYLESGHMVSQTYAVQSCKDPDFDKFFMRRDAVTAISKICYGRRFDPSVIYLSVNYLDRFFSAQGIPRGKKWVGRLVAVTCVTLAVKMMNAGFNVSDRQCGEEGFMFDAQTVEKMEMVILGALNWRMRSITPFSFLNFFISLSKFNDHTWRQALKSRAVEIIFKTQKETKLLEFNPSVVAASALIAACHELFPMQLLCFREAVHTCPYVDKEKLASCCEGMVTIAAAVAMEEEEEYDEAVVLFGGPVRSDTPANVLDRQWSGSSCSCCCSVDEQEDTTNRNATHRLRNDRSDNDGIINGSSSSCNADRVVTDREAKRQRSIGNDNCLLYYSPTSASSSSSY